MFTAVLFIIANIWKKPKCSPINKWIKKMWCIYTTEYYLAIKKKKEGNPAICDKWMDPEGLLLSKIKSENNKYYWVSLICGV